MPETALELDSPPRWDLSPLFTDIETARTALAGALADAKAFAERWRGRVATLAAAYTGLGNQTLADDARRVLQQNDPNHPYLHGDWPDYPSNLRKLNPFAGEKSALDND